MEADVRETILLEKTLVLPVKILAGHQFSQRIRKDQIVLLPAVSDFSL
jgi:hypothetical protein